MQNYIKSMDFPCQFLYYKPKAIVPMHMHIQVSRIAGYLHNNIYF